MELLVAIITTFENADEDFTINFNGKVVSGRVKVGEIKQFVLQK